MKRLHLFFCVSLALHVFPSYAVVNVDPDDYVIGVYTLTASQVAQFSTTDGRMSAFWDNWAEKDFADLNPTNNSMVDRDAFDGMHDARMTVKAGGTESGLYLYIGVEDDAWVDPASQDNWQYDMVDLYFDSYSSEEITAGGTALMVNPAYGWELTVNSQQINIWMGAASLPTDFMFNYYDDLFWDWSSNQVSFAASASLYSGMCVEVVEESDTRKAIEWFIPWSVYGKGTTSPPEAGKRMAFTIGYNDMDGDGDAVNSLRWRGSDPFTDLGQWGDLEIAGPLSIPDTSIMVMTPNTRVYWAVGSSHDITWYSSGVTGDVHIEYSTDNGSNWTTIVAATPDDGGYTWLVPDAVSEFCKIRVSEAADGAPSDESDAAFVIFNLAAPEPIPYEPDPTTNRTPTLQWYAVSGASNYRVIIDDAGDFAAPLLTVTTGGSTASYTPASYLPLGDIYWKVSSSFDYNLYSSADHFVLESVTPKVIAHWTFNDNGGITLADESGNGNDGDIYGARWKDGLEGSALLFDGVNDRVIVPDDPSMELTYSISIEAWVKLEQESADYQTICSKWYENESGSTTYNSFALEIMPNTTTPQLELNLSSGRITITSTFGIPAGEWAYIVGTYDAESGKIFINGSLAGEYVQAGTFITGHAPVTIGGHYFLNDAHCLAGYIDDLRLLNYALDPDSITIRYESSRPPLTPEIIAFGRDTTKDTLPALFWHPVEGAANYKILIDTAGNFSAPVVTAYTGGDTSFIPESPLPFGYVYWKVSSNLHYGIYSDTDRFYLKEQVEVPVLTYPYDTTTDRSPVLTWEAVEGAAAYRIILDYNGSFDSPVASVVVDSITRYLPTGLLPLGTIYWKVASNLDYSEFSAVDSFVVISLGTPQPRTPVEMSAIARSDTLSWSPVNDPSGAIIYELLIAATDDFSSDTIIAGDTTSDTMITIEKLSAILPEDRLLFWKVRACNAWDMKSAFSPTGSFSVLPAGGILLNRDRSLTNSLAVHARPNSSSIVIRYSLKQPVYIALNIYNVHGRLIRRIDNRVCRPGWYVFVWNGNDDHGAVVPAGYYIVRMESDVLVKSCTAIMID